MTPTAIIMPDPEGGYVAQNPETGTTSQGETIAEALANLKEATELYLEEFPRGYIDRGLTSRATTRELPRSWRILHKATNGTETTSRVSTDSHRLSQIGGMSAGESV